MQPEGLEPLSARKGTEGRTGNDRGPYGGKSEASAASPAAATQDRGGNKENAKSVEHSEKEREAQHKEP